MRVIVCDSYDQLSSVAADMIVRQINKKPDSVLGLATGSTPLGMYKELVRINKLKGVDFSQVTTFNLDEYVGLDPKNPCSYHYYMYDNFFAHININKERINIPNGISNDIEKMCKEYDKKIEEAGGIDLQILGIGHNGHIGFNEPGEFLKVGTHKTKLSSETIKANSRFFSSCDAVPNKAVTMGLGNILRSKEIILLASGESKADIIKKALNGTITTNVPASFLQLHPKVCVILDKLAAEKLVNA